MRPRYRYELFAIINWPRANVSNITAGRDKAPKRPIAPVRPAADGRVPLSAYADAIDSDTRAVAAAWVKG